MPRIDPDALAEFTEELLVGIGTPSKLASSVTESLVGSDLVGHSSHGVRQIISKYAAEIDDGRIDPTAEPVVERETPSSATVDGRWAYGQVVGKAAADVAVERAAESGVGLVGLKRTSHIGRVGEWAERACAADMAFVAFVCNPGSSWVAPAGSAQRRFSTNPIAIGVPTFGALEFPFVLDIATSQVAHGKIKERAAAGREIPNDWLVAPSGEPLTDPARFEMDDVGAILPFGGRTAGYKGFGLAVMAELLSANVADGTVSGMDDPIWGNHAAFFAVDLERFTTRERVAERAAAMAAYVRESDFSAPFGPGAAATGDETLLPGEAEYRTRKRNLEQGVPFSPEDVAAFVDIAREVGFDEGSIPNAFR